MTASFAQITPSFSPVIDGVGDYARLLGTHLETFGFESEYLVGDPLWMGGKNPSDRRAVAVTRRKAADLLAQLSSIETLILHYVGYGYDRSGIPFWLTRALAIWKRRDSRRRLVVVFHELWASGPPWKREFYTSFLQRRLVIALHRMCNFAVTSVPVMKEVLDRVAPGKTLQLPIPSAFPESVWTPRNGNCGSGFSIAIFGQEASRALTVERHRSLIRALEKSSLIKCIHVIGKGARTADSPSSDITKLLALVPSARVEAHCNVCPDEGARLLRQCDFYLSYYPSEYVCKSSALMAALACGCVPVLPEAERALPLRRGEEVLGCSSSMEEVSSFITWLRKDQLNAISRQGWEWYDQHGSWEVVTRAFGQLLCMPAAVPP